MAEETQEKLRLELGGDRIERSGGSQPPHDGGNVFAPCGRGDREAGEDSSATSSSDEEMPTTRRARILQRRGRARERELSKNKNESVPAEARTSECPGAEIRDPQDERCRGDRAGQTSYASHELTVFRVPPGMERRDCPGKRPLLLSASSGGFDCAGIEHVLSRWYTRGSAHPGHVSRHDAGGVQRWVILRLELQAAKQGEQTIRSVSIESDACGWRRVFEKLQRQPQNKRPLRSVSFLFRRAAAKKQIKMIPYHGRRSGDSVDRAQNSRTLEPAQEGERWKSATSARRYGKKSGGVNQTWSRACSISRTTLRALRQPLALSVSSWSRLSDASWAASPSEVDLAPICNVFARNRGIQCARLDP